MPICLSIAVFLISSLFSNLTLDPVLLPRFLAGSIFVLGFLGMITVQVSRSQTGFDCGIIYRAIFPAFICYLAISGLSLIKAINLAEGLFEWLKLFLFAAFFYSVVLVFINNRKGIPILVRGIILTATILSGIGICQYYRLGFTSIPGNYIIYATLAHKNLYASALFLMLPFAAYSVYKFSHFWQLAGWIAVVSLLISVVLARARTIWMAIIVATAAVGILVIIRHRESIGLGRQRWIRFNRYRSAGGLLCLLILTMTLVQFNDEIINTPSSSGKNKVSAAQLTPFVEPVWSLNTLNERFFLWHKSLAMAKANPLLGVGLGQWRLTFPAHGKIRQFRKSDEGRLAEISFKRPHNDYVWVLSETGMIGLLSYLAIVGIAIFYALKIYFKSDDTDNRALAIFMLFGIIGYMVISFFSFPKERIVPSIFFMLNLACIVSTYHRSFPKKFKFNRQQIFFINSLTLIVLSFCMIVGYICLDSETHVKKALIARQETNWQTVIEEIDKAESSFYQIDPVSVPLAWYRGVANQLLGRLDEALDDFKRAYQIHPNHIHVLNNLGTGYAQTGDYENAAEYYKKALDVWPEFAEARINLGVIYFHLGDFAEARHCFMLLDPNHEDARVSVYLQFIENRLGKSIQHKIIS